MASLPNASLTLIPPGHPQSWISLIVSISLAFCITALFSFYFRKVFMSEVGHHGGKSRAFPFFELPPELRDMVYEYLLEDPVYPVPSPNSSSSLVTSNGGIASAVGSYATWLTKTLTPHRAPSKPSSWILLASRQTYTEFLSLLTKYSTFHLSVNEKNASQPTLWTLPQQTLQAIRKCDLNLTTTSSMLGTSDPRQMPPTWALRDKILGELAGLNPTAMRDLNLHVRAVGDPLWNPLWVWFHASQSFKDTGAELKFQRITFSLDTWSPGENHMARDKQGEWAWCCREGHFLEADKPGLVIREFCAKLYAECEVCREGGERRE